MVGFQVFNIQMVSVFAMCTIFVVNSRCYKCSEDCQGYKSAVDHMVSEHDGVLAEDGSKQHLCALCPKVFGRRDHLKRHMYGHVENKAPKQRGRRPKEIEDEVS